jgi:hypothetical protein
MKEKLVEESGPQGYSKKDFEKDSRAVCVAGDDPSAGIVLWYEGAWLDVEIHEAGQGLMVEDLGLVGIPAGVSIWEGRYVTMRAVGSFRDLTPVEWVAFMNGDNPLEAPPEEVVVIDITIVEPTAVDIDLKFVLEHEKPTVVLDITKRWEEGIDHHPESERLFKELAAIDFEHCNDYFYWKSGGDGDNGETLMYQLDIIFERRDAR